jgi:hypothetical protein
MALTQVSTDGVKDDAITKAKIPADQIEASELADNAVDTNAIADDAITTAKIATSAITNTEIATGTISASRIVSGGLTAATLANDAITTDKVADNAITQAKINVPITNRNLIINGAMQVAQRGTSSTTSGYGSVDRFHIQYNAGTRTHSQTAITSGSPYENGFRNVLRITNTTVGGGAGNSGITNAFQYLEAQDVANSGWNYTSSSSFVTLSFWVRSSVAQEFYGYLRTFDGTEQAYCFSTGSLSANVWTKITKTISGNSNITINNDNGAGLQVNISPFWGGDFTTSGKTTDSWAAFSGANRTPDYATTWASTASATFDITGVQLEVGSTATDFEHRSFGQELALCQRYCQVLGGNQSQELLMHGTFNGAGTVTGFYEAAVQFRARPTFSISNVSHVNCYGFNGVDAGSPTSMSLIGAMTDKHWIYIDNSLSSNVGTGGLTAMVRANSTTSCKFTLDAEL